MTKDEWYRHTTWDSDIEQDFLDHLKRSHTPYNRAQYLRIQAAHLLGTHNKEYVVVAEKLLAKCVEEYPDDTFICDAYKLLADCKSFLGKYTDAEDLYRKAVKREFDFPNMKCNASLVFARFVIEHQKVELYDEVLQYLERVPPKDLVFPSERYGYFLPLAVIYEFKNMREEAKKFAQQALAEAWRTSSGFARHKDLGLVKEDKYVEVLERLVKNNEV